MRNKIFVAAAVILIAVAAVVLASGSKSSTECPNRPGCICTHK